MTRQDNTNISPSTWVSFIFGCALTYQFFHVLEHIFIFYQHWWLGISRLGAHGVLFFLDFEWSHFVFNLMYLIVLLAVFFGAGLHRQLSIAKHSIVFSLFLAGLLLQGYHVFEHTIRIWQHIQTGCEPCIGTGFLPKAFQWDDIYLHTFYNTAVLVLPAPIFFAFGFFKRFLKIWLP